MRTMCFTNVLLCLAISTISIFEYTSAQNEFRNMYRFLGNPKQPGFGFQSAKQLHNFADGGSQSLDVVNQLKVIQDIYEAFLFQSQTSYNYTGMLDAVSSSNEVSATCTAHLNMMIAALSDKEIWTLLMLDAMGKPGPGLLGGNVFWTGAYQQCIDTRATRLEQVQGTDKYVTTNPFNGRYCTVGIGPEKAPKSQRRGQISPFVLNIGVCVPDSCSAGDVKALLDNAYAEISSGSNSSLLSSEVVCQLELDYDAKAIVCIAFLGVLFLVICVATVYEVIVVLKLHKFKSTQTEIDENSPLLHSPLDGNNTDSLTSKYSGHESISEENGIIKNIQEMPKTESKLATVLLSFSLYNNLSKILSTKQPEGSLTAVNGIRVLSLAWVILGHSVSFIMPDMFGVATNSVPSMLSHLQQLWFYLIVNAFVAVDSFFTLSGLLVSYVSLKEMKKRSDVKKFPFGLFYLLRFWRLTPPLMLVLFVTATTSKYWNNGPYFDQTGFNPHACENNWWRNMFYINNFYKREEICMEWVWYLADDTQFYFISPLFIVALYLNAYAGVISCGLVILANAIARGVHAHANHLPISWYGGFDPDGKDVSAIHDAAEELYLRPYFRIGPYFVGILVGYILYKTECKPLMKKWMNLLGWSLTTIILVTVVFGDFGTVSGHTPFNQYATAIYWALNKTVWSAALGWIIYACATGFGGPINKILSLDIFVPVTRMTYMAYLVHPLIMYVYYSSKRAPIDANVLDSLYFFLGNLVLSFFCGFVTSLLFESPLVGLPKLFLKKYT